MSLLKIGSSSICVTSDFSRKNACLAANVKNAIGKNKSELSCVGGVMIGIVGVMGLIPTANTYIFPGLSISTIFEGTMADVNGEITVLMNLVGLGNKYPFF